MILLAVIAMAVTGFAAAGGFDWHLGAGYQTTFVDPSALEPTLDQLTALPIGIGAYIGLGYGFGEKKALNLGAEGKFAWSTSTSFTVNNISGQLRGYLKWRPAKIFTLAGYGGVAYESITDVNAANTFSNPAAVAGGRVTFLFLYAEYGVVFLDTLKHELGLGIAIKK